MSKNILLAILLVCGFCNFSYGLSAEQKELLYTLHYLGQDFNSIPMITENIDTFIDIFQAKVKVNEEKLARATKSRNDSVFEGIKKIGAVWVLSVLVNMIRMGAARETHRAHAWDASKGRFIYEVILNKLTILNISPEIDLLKKAAYVYSGVQLYESFKEERDLNKVLMLDREVLNKLQEVKNAEMEEIIEE
jgi:hypothetical protein